MRRYFKNWFGGQAKTTTRGARQPSARPQLEPLEGRRVPTASGTISSIVDASGNHVDYAIASDHSAWMHDAAGWHNLGGYVTQISAARDASDRAELFAIGSDHACYVYDAGGWHSLGGYVTQISGDFLRDRVYAIGSDHSAWVHDAAGWHGLGGYVTQISAGTDAGGGLKLFAIGADQCCWGYDASGWQSLGLGATQVCGTATADECWITDANHAVWRYTTASSTNLIPAYGFGGQGGTWCNFGGYALALSAGYGSSGREEVFAIGGDHAAWVCDAQPGAWRSLGGNLTAISATVGDALFARAADGTFWGHDAGGWHNYSGFSPLGNYVATIYTAQYLAV
jgi:hypothetical protein